MALFKAPVEDTRFVESNSLSIESFLPLGSVVMPLNGQYRGCKGVVTAYSSPSSTCTSTVEEVEVEFDQFVEEAPFGYNITTSIGEQHYSSRDVCQALQISTKRHTFKIKSAINTKRDIPQALSCWGG